MKKIIILFMCCLMLACHNNVEDEKLYMQSIHYHKDVATNLCFASLWIGFQAGTITNVPCTPEVEKLAILF